MLAIEQNPATIEATSRADLSAKSNTPRTYEERMQAIRASISNPDPLLSFYGGHYKY